MVSSGAVTSLGAQSADESVALKGPGHRSSSSLSTACVSDKQPGLESSHNPQVVGVERRRQIDSP